MSKNALKAKASIRKKEKSIKKAKQKKLIIMAVLTLAVLVVSVSVLNLIKREKTTETYSYYGQTVRLFPNGKFSAILAHNIPKNGTYTKVNEGGRIHISFNINGYAESGWIINNNLHIPGEWDDGHGHGNIFPKIK